MAKKGSKFTKYSYEFKTIVVEDYLSGKSGGYKAVSQKHGLKSKTQVEEWVKIYRENPMTLAQDKRGTHWSGKSKSKELASMELEEKIKYLEMENAILKKLRALQQKSNVH